MAGQRDRDARRGTGASPTGDEQTLAADSHARGAVSEPSDTSSTPGTAGATAAAEGRTGEDERRRGWFWHWNSVVTQYAPLIGLKGVGLLNSYTVWTDRREESPHRGYAFPSQQAEADFYGEDRSELITINKILVALDLIEIRKEMIQRTDERGRRWRVPHNLYRVRDRPDGMTLRSADVLRVAELAARDEAVFRYVRRIFSDRFRPIDRDNVWHAILTEVGNDPTWQAQRERALELERRASARTRAGHRTRAGRDVDEAALLTDGQLDAQASTGAVQPERVERGAAVVAADGNEGRRSPSEAAVAGSNDGSEPGAGESNTGLTAGEPPTVGDGNSGRAPSVGVGNTTYDQPRFTTTTTTTVLAGERELEREPDAPALPNGAGANGLGATGGTTPAGAAERHDVMDEARSDGWHEGQGGSDDTLAMADARGLADRAAAAPARQRDGERPRDVGRDVGSSGGAAADRRADRAGAGGPLVDPSPLVLSLYEAANDRRARPLERDLLAELERDADPAARAAGSTGSEWVAAALREAVASGSAFVAPKYLREIVNRWAASGGPPAPAAPAPAVTPPAAASSAATSPAGDVRLPGGASAAAVWSAVLAELARLLDAAAFERLLAGSAITRYWRGTVEVAVPSPCAAGKLDAEYRGLVERQLNARLKRPVDVRFHVAPPVGQPSRPAPPAAAPSPSAATDPSTGGAAVVGVSADDLAVGRQLWRALLDDAALVLPVVDRARLADGALLGERADGVFLLGVSSPAACPAVERHRAALEPALARLLGRPARLAAVPPDGCPYDATSRTDRSPASLTPGWRTWITQPAAASISSPLTRKT